MRLHHKSSGSIADDVLLFHDKSGNRRYKHFAIRSAALTFISKSQIAKACRNVAPRIKISTKPRFAGRPSSVIVFALSLLFHFFLRRGEISYVPFSSNVSFCHSARLDVLWKSVIASLEPYFQPNICRIWRFAVMNPEFDQRHIGVIVRRRDKSWLLCGFPPFPACTGTFWTYQ